MPAKYSAYGVVLAIIGIALSFLLYYLSLPSTGADALIAEHKELLKRLNVQTSEQDRYGLTALRVGDAYAHLPEAKNFLEALQLYRSAMMQGNGEAERKVFQAYWKLIRATVDTKHHVLMAFFVLDDSKRLIFLEYFGVPPQALTKDKPVPLETRFTVPADAKGSLTFITCVDVLDIVRESDETDNCKRKTFKVGQPQK